MRRIVGKRRCNGESLLQVKFAAGWAGGYGALFRGGVTSKCESFENITKNKQ